MLIFFFVLMSFSSLNAAAVVVQQQQMPRQVMIGLHWIVDDAGELVMDKDAAVVEMDDKEEDYCSAYRAVAKKRSTQVDREYNKRMDEAVSEAQTAIEFAIADVTDKKPAVILDFYDVAVGWNGNAWKAIPQMLKLYNTLKNEHGCRVFFITEEDKRDFVLKTLRAEGYNVQNDDVYCMPESYYTEYGCFGENLWEFYRSGWKEDQRVFIEKYYTIVATFDWDSSDLTGQALGHVCKLPFDADVEDDLSA